MTGAYVRRVGRALQRQISVISTVHGAVALVNLRHVRSLFPIIVSFPGKFLASYLCGLLTRHTPTRACILAIANWHKLRHRFEILATYLLLPPIYSTDTASPFGGVSHQGCGRSRPVLAFLCVRKCGYITFLSPSIAIAANYRCQFNATPNTMLTLVATHISDFLSTSFSLPLQE